MLHLTVEAEDPGVLDAIRAALPDGSRLQVRIEDGLALALMPARRTPRPAFDLSELTARQRDVLALLAQGLSNKDIARRLALSHFTVRNHVVQLMRIFHATSRGEVVARVGAAVPGIGSAPEGGDLAADGHGTSSSGAVPVSASDAAPVHRTVG